MKKLILLLALLIPLNSAAGASLKPRPQSSEGVVKESKPLEVIDFKELKELQVPIKNNRTLDVNKVHFRHELKEENKGLLSKVRSAFPSLHRVESGIPADAVDLGLEWLLTAQNEDGGWGNTESNFSTTQAAMEFLHWISANTGNDWTEATDWVRLFMPFNNDSSARKIFSMALNEEYTADLSQYFVTEVNPITGGFGYNKDYQADTVTTSLALKALTKAAYFGEDGTDITVYKTLRELLVSQNSDGGFGYTQTGESTLYATELAVDALLPYDGTTLAYTSSSGEVEVEIAPLLDAAFNYIKSLQNEDGSIGQNVGETAFAYDLLLRRNDYPTENTSAIEYLLNAQSTEGSYSDSDPYSTALALKALAKPDLEIGTVSVDTDIPEVDATLTIPITNIGYLEAEPYTLEIRLNGSDFVTTEIPYTMARNSTVNVNLDITGGFPIGNYDFEFNVIPSSSVGELDPENNSATFSVSYSTYDGPTPPTWFGAATSSTSGRITLTWLPSEDPELDHYKVYIGTSPGSYSYESSNRSSTSVGVTFSGFTSDVPYYFNIVAFDAAGVRGDYAMESSAVAKTTPSQSAGLFGSVTADGDPVPNATLTLHAYGDVITTDSNGEFDVNIYPGNYYFTAEQTGYSEDAQGVSAVDGSDTEVLFELEEINDGIAPSPVELLSATPGDSEIELAWTSLSETDFDHYAIYRSNSNISTLSSLTPITTISEQSTVSYLDSSISNGLNYYYTVTGVDRLGNESSSFTVLGPIVGNSAPNIENIRAEQEEGTVRIMYDMQDSENESMNVTLDYFDGASWNTVLNASGLGIQTAGTDKTILWNAKTEFPNQDLDTAQIRITVDDLQTVNNSTSLESAPFSLDTQSPMVSINSQETTDPTPQISGTVDEDLSSLEVLINGNSYSANINIDDLNWSVDVSADLAEGYYDISATATDLLGNSSNDSSSYELLVDLDNPVTSIFYSGAGDGYITGTARTLWSTIHDALSGGTVSYTATKASARVGKLSTEKFTIERIFLPFNTSSLPEDANILTATLYTYVDTKTDRDNDGDDFVTVVQTNQTSNTSLVVGDYDQAGAISNPIEGSERKDLTNFSAGSYLSFLLNETGLSWISLDGYTKLGIREGHDVVNSAFTGTANQKNLFQIRASEYAGTEYDPYLSVSYELPVDTHYDSEGNAISE